MGREEKVGSRISERGEEDANRELQDLEEGQQQAMAVEGRLGGLLAEQGRVQEEKSQGALDRHWRRLKEKQKERQGKLENAALESEDFATRVNDQVDRLIAIAIIRRMNCQVHKEHGNLVETIEEEAKVDIAR